MNIKELEKLMVDNSLVIRAIPRELHHLYESRYLSDYPNGTIVYPKGFNRPMLRVASFPLNGGKFIIEQVISTGSTIKFQPKGNYYNTMEEAILGFMALGKDLVK